MYIAVILTVIVHESMHYFVATLIKVRVVNIAFGNSLHLFRKRQIMERIASFHALPYNCRKIDIGSFYYNQEDRKCRLLANNVFLCQSRSDSSPNAAGAA